MAPCASEYMCAFSTTSFSSCVSLAFSRHPPLLPLLLVFVWYFFFLADDKNAIGSVRACAVGAFNCRARRETSGGGSEQKKRKEAHSKSSWHMRIHTQRGRTERRRNHTKERRDKHTRTHAQKNRRLSGCKRRERERTRK